MTCTQLDHGKTVTCRNCGQDFGGGINALYSRAWTTRGNSSRDHPSRRGTSDDQQEYRSPTMTTVTEPGIYDIPEADYHADQASTQSLGRSLSVSGAKTLLVNPARFLWEREHGRPPKRVFDIGTVAHAMVLGNPDSRIRVIDAYDWRTKAAKDARDAAYDQRNVPVHRGELRDLAPLRRAVRAHPLASAILSQGESEKSIYWIDEDSGVPCRGRLDWVRDNALVDVKTVAGGGTDDAALARAAANFDWPMQAAHYTDGWEAITGQRLPFLFLAVEKEPPYLIRVVQLSDADIDAGRERMAHARDLFAQYEAEGYPASGADIDTIQMPRWYAS